MILRYDSHRAVEALLLSRTEETVRVLARGAEDVEELRKKGGVWISENCEPVQIEFHGKSRQQPVTEADCICSKELASHLIHLLLSGASRPAVVAFPGSSAERPASCVV